MANEKEARARAKLDGAGAAAASAAHTANGSSSSNGGGLTIETDATTLRIGDVAVPRRSPLDTALVPHPHFVAIAEHVRVLREMLLDWSLGQHLLLLGVQVLSPPP